MSHKDPEAARAYAREYRRKWAKKHPEKARAASKRWYDKNKEYVKKYQKSWRERRTEGYLLSAARRRAKKFGLEFNLELSDISVPEVCPALGIPIRRNATKWDSSAPSLDRVNPAKGYIKGNVRVISLRANQLKRDATPLELWNLYLYSEGLR